MKTAIRMITLFGGVAIPAAPTLTAPAASAVLTDTTPDFTWAAVAGAATYDIEIRVTLTGTPTATGIATNSYTPGVALDAALTYSWRVRAVNAGGTAGAWSETRTFTFSLDTYLLSLTPTLLFKFDEASGNTVNYGSDGGAGTTANITYAQPGQLGNAYSFNGDTSVVTVANAAISGTKALSGQRWCWLANPANAGESNQGVFFTYADLINAYTLRFTTSNRLIAAVDCVTTDALVISGLGVDFLTAWTLVFADFDADNVLGLGRRIRLFRATAASATALLALGTNNAGVGNVVSQTGDLKIGNRNAGDSGFNGLVNRCFAGSGLWSPAGAPTDLTIMDTIRAKTFGV